MIQVDRLKKSYGDGFQLHIESLAISGSETVGLVGNNGAGKTTLLKSILDLIKLDEGSVLSEDVPVAGHEHWKAYTGSYLNESFLVPFYSPSEYFELVRTLYGRTEEELSETMNSFNGFWGDDFLSSKKLIRDLSQGNKSKVGIAAALIGEPRLLVLDEPFANLDPSSQLWLKSRLQKLSQQQSTSLLISSHDLIHVAEICDRILILEDGKLKEDLQVSEGTLEHLNQYFSV